MFYFIFMFMLRFKWNLFLNWFSIWKKKKFHHIPLIDSCYAMFIFQSSYNWTKLMACFVKNSIAGCFIFIMWHNLPNFLTIPRSKGKRLGKKPCEKWWPIVPARRSFGVSSDLEMFWGMYQICSYKYFCPIRPSIIPLNAVLSCSQPSSGD